MTPAFLWALAGLFAMSLFGGGLAPLPISAYVLWMGKFHQPLAVIAVGTLGSMIGWLVVGRLMARVLPSPALTPVATPGARTQWAVFLVNAAPLPLDPVRFLALRQGIAPRQVLWALTGGRAVRYALLVFLGAALAPYSGLFWGLLALILLPMLWRAASSFWQRRMASPSPAPDAAR